MSIPGAARLGGTFARDPVEVWTARLEQEPAVRAWQELEAGPRPSRLELLRSRPKSVVFRLPGVGQGGSDVIAKQCLWQIALDERAVYDLLAELPDAGLIYYGFVAEPACELGWLFLEDARGDPWNPADLGERQIAARWLAELHTRSSRTNGAARLPDRGPSWFHGHLHDAHVRIREGRANPVLAPEEGRVLDGMLRLLDAVEACWPEIETACAALPRALAHGDFADRNVRLRREGAEPRVLVFDWEMAGWGLPAVDLPSIDLPAYAAAVRADWPQLDRAELARCLQLGNLLRGGIAATRWAAESLATAWPHHSIRNLSHYQRRITQALHALGLRTTGTAP